MANDNPEEAFDAFVRAREDQANSVINASAAGTSAEELVQTPEQEELSCIESKSSDEGDASAEESEPELQERAKYQTPHKKLQQKGGLSIHKDIPQNQNKINIMVFGKPQPKKLQKLSTNHKQNKDSIWQIQSL